jgi:hypothetical protein
VVDFVLYPNPATNEITINAARTIMGSGYTIIDQTGKTILLGKLVNETTVINLDRLTVGTYLFRVSYGSQQLFEILK